MGFYKNGKYVYEPMDAGNGLCDQKTYDDQRRQEQKKRDQENAGGMISGDIQEQDNHE